VAEEHASIEMDRDDAVVVVVLTALELEYRSVRRWLSQVRRHNHPAGTVFEVGALPNGEEQIALALTGAGNTASGVLAERAIAMFRPRAMMFVGIAGALMDDIALGDVVVATKVYAYHGGSAQPDGFRARPRSWEIPHHVDQIARHVYRTGSWTALLTSQPSAPAPAVHFRPIAAGEVVLNSRDAPLYRTLRRTYDDAAAIEMESAGLAHAGHLNGSLPVITVRGISDLADGGKYVADGQGWRRTAAANAAAFALAVAADLCSSTPTATSATTRAGLPRNAAPGTVEVPHELPAQGAPFVGRTALMSRLDTILLGSDDDSARVAVLTGMAGIGKTALAVRWARRAARAFPDGLLYADARGYGPDAPLRPHEIVARFLRALGQSRTAEQGSLDERSARFRTLVSGRHLLIVLDNVRSLEQVRPVLPGSTSVATLITSRQRLRGLTIQYGAELLEVGPMAPEDGERLLRAAIGERAVANPRGTSDLVSQCGGLPLALRIAAEMVRSQPLRTLDSLAAELAGSGAVLDLLDAHDDPYSMVRAVFSWSYQALPDHAATAFRLLGLHPGNAFALPACAALLGVSPRDATATLRSLLDAHLVFEADVDRYGMHDLLRAYAKELCARTDEEPVRRTAQRRLFDQYSHSADRAGRVIMPHRYRPPLAGAPTVEPRFEGRRSAVRWFDLERHNLVEICRLDDTTLDSRRWRLAYSLRDYFYLSKHLDGWLESHRVAVAGCVRLGDRRAEGITRNNLGRALLEAGRTDAAATQYRLAQALLEEVGDQHGVMDSLVNLASVLRRQHAYGQALQYQQAALDFYQRTGLARKAGIALRGIARTEVALGRLEEAAVHAQEALTVFMGIDLHLDTTQALITLARIHQLRGQHDLAEAAAQRAIGYSRRADSEFERAQALRLLGSVAADTGNTELARRYWTEALTIFRAHGAILADAVTADLQGLATR
jgi:nucleoside phosphorylase